MAFVGPTSQSTTPPSSKDRSVASHVTDQSGVVFPPSQPVLDHDRTLLDVEVELFVFLTEVQDQPPRVDRSCH